jgi:aldose sugar dehydrogenase
VLVNWSDGQNGSTVNVSPKQSSRISATCTVSNQTSASSNSVLIQVELPAGSCGGDMTLINLTLNNNLRYRTNTKITATDVKINPSASYQFKAQNSVLLNAGFEAKTGSVFKAFIGRCNSDFQTKDLTTGLLYPWEILWGPDNYIWMTERWGRISRVNPETGAVTPLLTIADVTHYGEGGLLGMVLHPDFTNNPYVYIVYNYGPPPTGVLEKVVRYTYNGTTLVSPTILFDNIAGWVNHNGSRLVITPDLKLFITTGDAANTNTPQDDNSVNGKILRINLDGTIPADNPNPVQTPVGAIWSKGHRNSQGMVWVNNKLYVSSHGDGTEDEINLITKNGNFGYFPVAGPCDTPAEMAFCSANSTIQPIFSSGNVTWAFCGLDYYNSDAYPRWKNSLLLATLKNQTLYQFKLSDDGNTIVGGSTSYFGSQFGRLRDIAISPSGKIYLCTSNGGNADKIIEATPVVD